MPPPQMPSASGLGFNIGMLKGHKHSHCRKCLARVGICCPGKPRRHKHKAGWKQSYWKPGFPSTSRGNEIETPGEIAELLKQLSSQAYLDVSRLGPLHTPIRPEGNGYWGKLACGTVRVSVCPVLGVCLCFSKSTSLVKGAPGLALLHFRGSGSVSPHYHGKNHPLSQKKMNGRPGSEPHRPAASAPDHYPPNTRAGNVGNVFIAKGRISSGLLKSPGFSSFCH